MIKLTETQFRHGLIHTNNYRNCTFAPTYRKMTRLILIRIITVGDNLSLEKQDLNALRSRPLIFRAFRMLVSKQVRGLIGFRSPSAYKIVWTDMEMQSRRVLKPLKCDIGNIHALRCYFNVYIYKKKSTQDFNKYITPFQSVLSLYTRVYITSSSTHSHTKALK